ncbi:MAG: DedA family protein [Bacillota bacterium]
MFNFIEDVLLYILKLIDCFGYWGIGLGMLLESACIPIPSELVLPLGGFMVSEGRITMLEANISVAAGSMIGSLAAYAIGYLGGRPFILKYGKYFFISEKHFYMAEKTFNKYGSIAVFFGRLLPVIRTFISLPSGIAKMDIKKFLLYSLLGMVLWNYLLIYIGFKFGQNYESVVRPIFHKFEYAVIGLIALAFSYLIYKLYKTTKKAA